MEGSDGNLKVDGIVGYGRLDGVIFKDGVLEIVTGCISHGINHPWIKIRTIESTLYHKSAITNPANLRITYAQT